jgi:outer membrane biosynthesis protein TonB
MISQLEDERRWARLREGVLWAVLLHALLLLVLFLLPRYVFVPRIIEPKISAKNQDWTYLDSPRIPVAPPVRKPLVRPPEPQVDKKTLEALNKPPAPPAPVAEQPKLEQPKLEQPRVAVPPPIPPSQQSQSQIEAPQPKAVPARRPDFAMGSQNPADQLRDAMKGASRSPGYSTQAPGGLSMHPGAGTGGVEVLSDRQGVDFNNWLIRWHRETERTWDPLIPDEVNPPILKQGQVQIRFKVGPNGRIIDGSMLLEGRSGDTALDRAAWGALTGSNYPPLPREFHGPYLELRAVFMYNMKVQ